MTDLKLLIHAAVGQGKYVGTNPGVVGVWQVARHVTFQGAITPELLTVSGTELR